MPIADLAHRAQVAVGRHDDAVGAGDRLEDDGGHRVRPFVLQDLLQMRAARAHRTRIRMAGRTAVRVRIEHAHHARQTGLGGPAPGVAGERDGAGRGAVV